MSPQDQAFLDDKPDLMDMGDAALNAETPAHLLDEPVTPTRLFFIRNNGAMPQCDLSPDAWTLRIDGEVDTPLTLSPAELAARFEIVTLSAVMECAGNGRAFFPRPTDGAVKWGLGAVGCARWTGVRLADILHEAGIGASARYIAHHSPDRDLERDAEALSRGLPLWKALSPETLVCFAMNGAPLEAVHGAPLRIVAPGFPGSAWQKWLAHIHVRDREHDGAKMTGYDYRLPTRPLVPGELPDVAEMAVIEDMPVKSLITAPPAGACIAAGGEIEIRGFAWSGHTPLARVEISCDSGISWRAARLEPTHERFAWSRFRFAWTPRETGEVTLVARAADARGRAQPLISAPWNPMGYNNNRCPRVTVAIG